MAKLIATNLDIAQYAGKRDILRMIKGEGNSPFIRISVHTDRKFEGQVLVRRPNVITGDMELVWVLPYNTTPADQTVLKIETISYSRNDPLGATALDGIKRWFETVDTAFVAVHREEVPAVLDAADGKEVSPATRKTVVDTFMRKDAANRNEFVTGSVLPLAHAESNEDLECWSGEFLARLDKNVAAVDHRVKDWTQKSVNTAGEKQVKEIRTAYGMFMDQRERDNAARKNVSKA